MIKVNYGYAALANAIIKQAAKDELKGRENIDSYTVSPQYFFESNWFKDLQDFVILGRILQDKRLGNYKLAY